MKKKTEEAEARGGAKAAGAGNEVEAGTLQATKTGPKGQWGTTTSDPSTQNQQRAIVGPTLLRNQNLQKNSEK
jgi:hypothetical protein